MSFSDQQIEQLLKPIRPSRVVKDPKGMQYVEQHDIRAHLNRLFGFGNWDQQVTRLDLVFEEPTKILDRETKKPKPDRWDVCYSASVKLAVRGPDGGLAASRYEDAATGFAQNQTRGEAHDLALKSAVSTALKRAATSLGDQFGLSLYAGTTNAIVRGIVGYNPEKPDGVEGADNVVAFNNAEGRHALRILCEQTDQDMTYVAKVFEERMKKAAKVAPNEDLLAFVNLVKTGQISLGSGADN